jgi:hypothetical protein
MGKFIVGNPTDKNDNNSIVVAHPLDLDEVEAAMKNCCFVDGFDLASARGVGIIAVAPEHFFDDENVSTCVRYAFGKAKEIIGDGLVFRGQYIDNSKNFIEFYLIYNGLTYPEERFERMWTAIKEGKTLQRTKLERIDDVPYEVKLETANSGQNFKRLQNMSLGREEHSQIKFEKPAEKKPCPNCYPDPITRRSTGVYRKGGPMPFSSRTCPMCQNSGKVK